MFTLYNFKTGMTDTLFRAEAMDDETAKRYIPDTPRSLRIYHAARKAYGKTPYEAVILVNDVIFNGVKIGEKTHDTGD